MDHILALLSDLKDHLDRGGQLAGSHLPVLAEVAGKIAEDPFVQAAIGSVLSPEGKTVVIGLAQQLEALERAHAAAAAEQPATGA